MFWLLSIEKKKFLETMSANPFPLVPTEISKKYHLVQLYEFAFYEASMTIKAMIETDEK